MSRCQIAKCIDKRVPRLCIGRCTLALLDQFCSQRFPFHSSYASQLASTMISIATRLTFVLLLSTLSPSLVVAEQKAYLKSAHRNSVNPGFSKGDCPTSPKNDPYGWHFILKGSTAAFKAINCTFRLAGTVTEMIQQPSNKHAYVFTPTSDTLVDAWAMIDGSDTEFVLSHVCSPSGVSASLTTTTTKLSTFASFRDDDFHFILA